MTSKTKWSQLQRRIDDDKSKSNAEQIWRENETECDKKNET